MSNIRFIKNFGEKKNKQMSLFKNKSQVKLYDILKTSAAAVEGLTLFGSGQTKHVFLEFDTPTIAYRYPIKPVADLTQSARTDVAKEHGDAGLSQSVDLAHDIDHYDFITTPKFKETEEKLHEDIRTSFITSKKLFEEYKELRRKELRKERCGCSYHAEISISTGSGNINPREEESLLERRIGEELKKIAKTSFQPTFDEFGNLRLNSYFFSFFDGRRRIANDYISEQNNIEHLSCVLRDVQQKRNGQIDVSVCSAIYFTTHTWTDCDYYTRGDCVVRVHCLGIIDFVDLEDEYNDCVYFLGQHVLKKSMTKTDYTTPFKTQLILAPKSLRLPFLNWLKTNTIHTVSILGIPHDRLMKGRGNLSFNDFEFLTKHSTLVAKSYHSTMASLQQTESCILTAFHNYFVDVINCCKTLSYNTRQNKTVLSYRTHDVGRKTRAISPRARWGSQDLRVSFEAFGTPSRDFPADLPTGISPPSLFDLICRDFSIRPVRSHREHDGEQACDFENENEIECVLRTGMGYVFRKDESAVPSLLFPFVVDCSLKTTSTSQRDGMVMVGKIFLIKEINKDYFNIRSNMTLNNTDVSTCGLSQVCNDVVLESARENCKLYSRQTELYMKTLLNFCKQTNTRLIFVEHHHGGSAGFFNNELLVKNNGCIGGFYSSKRSLDLHDKKDTMRSQFLSYLNHRTKCPIACRAISPRARWGSPNRDFPDQQGLVVQHQCNFFFSLWCDILGSTQVYTTSQMYDIVKMFSGDFKHVNMDRVLAYPSVKTSKLRGAFYTEYCGADIYDQLKRRILFLIASRHVYEQESVTQQHPVKHLRKSIENCEDQEVFVEIIQIFSIMYQRAVVNWFETNFKKFFNTLTLVQTNTTINKICCAARSWLCNLSICSPDSVLTDVCFEQDYTDLMLQLMSKNERIICFQSVANEGHVVRRAANEIDKQLSRGVASFFGQDSFTLFDPPYEKVMPCKSSNCFF